MPALPTMPPKTPLPRPTQCLYPATLQALLPLLDARPLNPFGNYTALLSDYQLDPSGTIDPHFGIVHLHASHNDSWLAKSCRLVCSNTCPAPGNLDTLPSDWPTPAIDSLLPALRGAYEARIITPHAAWFAHGGSPHVTPIPRRARPSFFAQNSLPGMFWPTSDSIGTRHVNISISFLRDPTRPTLLGLQWSRQNRDHLARSNILQRLLLRLRPPRLPILRQQTTWWLDPSNDDLPVYVLHSIFNDDGELHLTIHDHYLEYAQLPTGVRFPSHWRQEYTRINATGQSTTSTTYHRLQISPTLLLDPSWFQKPHPQKASLTTVPSPHE